MNIHNIQARSRTQYLICLQLINHNIGHQDCNNPNGITRFKQHVGKPAKTYVGP
jgi:hypothetical protein